MRFVSWVCILLFEYTLGSLWRKRDEESEGGERSLSARRVAECRWCIMLSVVSIWAADERRIVLYLSRCPWKLWEKYTVVIMLIRRWGRILLASDICSDSNKPSYVEEPQLWEILAVNSSTSLEWKMVIAALETQPTVVGWVGGRMQRWTDSFHHLWRRVAVRNHHCAAEVLGNLEYLLQILFSF